MVSILKDNYKNENEIFNSFPRVESKRFYLREITNKNFNDIYNLFLDDEVMRFSGINIVDPFRQVNNYLKTISIMYLRKQGIRWAIYDKLNNNFVGDIGLFNIDDEENSIEVGYLIAKKYWNKGIGAECCKAIIEFAFNNLAVEKIMAIIDRENIASMKLVKKLGFKMEGEFNQLTFNRFRRCYNVFSFKKQQIQ